MKLLKHHLAPIGVLLVAIICGVGLASLPASHVLAQGRAGLGADPCVAGAARLSAFADITTATTTSITSISGTTVTWVCSLLVTMSGTTAADTIQFIAGSGATCGTGTVNLSPVFNSGIMTNGSTVLSLGGYGAVFKPTIQSTHVCAVTTVGTGPAIDVLLTYVQQ